jgi:hypothetical protein
LLRDNKQPEYHEYQTREALLVALRLLRPEKRLAERIRIWVFKGLRLQTTKPPFPYLLEPGAMPAPLFIVPDAGIVDEEGTFFDDEEFPDRSATYEAATKEAMEQEQSRRQTEAEETPLGDDPDAKQES